MIKTRICSRCKIEKRHREFFKDSRKKDGIRYYCKDCSKQDTANWREKNRSEYNNYVAEWRAKNPDKQHATDIKRNYGLSIKEYNEMLVKQNCGCLICGKQHDPSVKRGRLYVDHCHKTKKIRDLLCANCNSGIGNLQHNVEILKKAIAYLNLPLV